MIEMFFVQFQISHQEKKRLSSSPIFHKWEEPEVLSHPMKTHLVIQNQN